MLRVMDGRTRCLTGIPAGLHRGLVTMCVHLASGEEPPTPTDVRALLIGDVLMRTLEGRGIQVLHALAGPGRPAERTGDLRQVISGFGIHPPDDGSVGPGAPADMHVSADAPNGAEPGLWIEVGPVRRRAPAGQDTDLGGADPLATRLALLARPHARPVELSPDTLTEAERTLGAWRRQVASWANSPSKPVPGDLRRRAEGALDDDLGTRGVLETLRQVEAEDTVPDGAKFETFALLDRVLGLELAREVGRA
ncbi:hypothetical protein [Streptomyces sp. NPDC048385]|uniref:hypothetical protein n=1 Tax=unclassified Streptomyces TaxID=2593676 RepID=UPI00343FC162